MRRPNINVAVSGPLRDAALYQYKTVILKAALPFADQVTQPYTKYVIKWDFDLGGQTVTVPENCILEFDGGSLKNGTIIGHDTLFINVGDVDIWGENLTRLGTWRENGGGDEQVQSDWDETDPENKAFIKNKPIVLSEKEYDPEHHSGLGRKTLELKDDSNILTQEDFDKANTVYVIPYDFELIHGSVDYTKNLTERVVIGDKWYYYNPDLQHIEVSESYRKILSKGELINRNKNIAYPKGTVFEEDTDVYFAKSANIPEVTFNQSRAFNASKSGTITVDDDTYYVTDAITVPGGFTLSIPEGYYFLNSDGSIIEIEEATSYINTSGSSVNVIVGKSETDFTEVSCLIESPDAENVLRQETSISGNAYFFDENVAAFNVLAGYKLKISTSYVILNSSGTSVVFTPTTESPDFIPVSDTAVKIGKLVYDKESELYTISKCIVIPENCILEFEGGSISNGIFAGTDTVIKAPPKAIFTGMAIAGTWNVQNIYSAWFSDITSENILRQLINLTSDRPENMYIDEGEYCIAVEETNGVGIEFAHDNTYIHNSGTIKLKPNDHWGYFGLLLSGNNITLDGGEFVGDAKDHDYTSYQDTNRATHEWGRGIVIRGEGVVVQNIKSSLCTADAFNVVANNIILRNIVAEKCRRQGITGGSIDKVTYSDNIIIENFKISEIGDFVIDGVSISGTNPGAAIDIEPNKNNLPERNIVIRNGVISNCRRGVMVYRTKRPFNEHCIIENIVIDSVNIGIRLKYTKGAVISNVSITNANKGVQCQGISANSDVMPHYLTINNLRCILKGDNEEVSDSVIFDVYRTWIIVNNSFLAGHYIEASSSSLRIMFNSCTIINDYPIDRGRFWFNNCNIANNVNLGFAHSRPLTLTPNSNLALEVYLKDCTVTCEGSQTWSVRLNGKKKNLTYLKAENCTFADDKTNSQVMIAVANYGIVEVVDCKFESVSESPIYLSIRSDHGVEKILEKYVRLYQNGTKEERPTELTVYAKGHCYYDSDLGKPIYWSGYTWRDAAGEQITWRISYSLTHISASNYEQPDAGMQYTTVLAADEGYVLPSTITIKMGDATLTAGTDYTYDSSTGEVVVLGIGGTGGVTGSLKITATGEAQSE